MDTLADGVAVVTGAASGIGLALARRFAGESMSVVMADVEEGALRASADAVRALGPGDVEAVRCDVSEPPRSSARRGTLERFGGVHVLCNNAGVVTLGSTWEQSADDWRWVLDVDLWGVVHGVRTFVPILLRQGVPGHVVNTASIAGLLPSPTIAPYNAAKAGVVAISETLDIELRAPARRSGCRCCAPASCRRGSPRAGATDRAPTAVRNRCSTCPPSTTSHRRR